MLRRLALVAGALAIALALLVSLAPSSTHQAAAQAPTSPPVEVCGNATLLAGPSSAPAGAVTVPAGNDTGLFETWEMEPDTTYWFAAGTHTLGSTQYDEIDATTGDIFEGAPGAVIDGQGVNQSAFDDDATGVTVEYLTIEDFESPEGQMVVNHTGGANWTVAHDTVEDNGGAAVGMASGSVVEDDCLTHNTEYGFSSFGTSHTVTLEDSEISYNDSTGTYDKPTTSASIQCGCSGGGKFWATINGTVIDNYVHDNGDVGIWVDTDNAGFDISGNYIADNSAEGIIYEISYNALISDNTLIGNAIGYGPSVQGFPDSALYVSESGGDSRVHSNYSGTFTVSGNAFIDNWGGVVVWENSNRYCGDTSDQACTLVTPATYTITSCRAHLTGSKPTQTPDYYDNCRWKAQNVTVTHNTFDFTRTAVGADCTEANFCGFNGLFSEYGTTAPWKGWVVPLNISDNQNNHFSDNTYNGPWSFDAFTDGEVVTWTQWTKGFAAPTSAGNFDAQDAGSTYDGTAIPTTTTTTKPPATTTTTTTKPPTTTTTTTTDPPATTTTTTDPPATTTTTTDPPATTTTTTTTKGKTSKPTPTTTTTTAKGKTSKPTPTTTTTTAKGKTSKPTPTTTTTTAKGKTSKPTPTTTTTKPDQKSGRSSSDCWLVFFCG